MPLEDHDRPRQRRLRRSLRRAPASLFLEPSGRVMRSSAVAPYAIDHMPPTSSLDLPHRIFRGKKATTLSTGRIRPHTSRANEGLHPPPTTWYAHLQERKIRLT